MSHSRDLVTLRRDLFGRVREKSLVTSNVSTVAQVEFYQQNYQPVYGVEIRGRDGKLRFGTTLQDAEKAWLAADIKRAVFGLFSLIPIIVGLAFGGIGVMMITSTWPGRAKEVRLEGDETQVALRTYQHGRVIRERSFPRTSVSGALATHTGHAHRPRERQADETH